MDITSPWEILGVPETASDDAVKLAWRKLILKCHPDKAAEDQKEAKAEEFKRVNEAYKTITEPELRRKYEDDKERKKRFAESGPSGAAYAAANPVPARTYHTRMAAPPPSAYAGAPREHGYEYSRSPEDYHEDMRASSRKYDGYDGHHYPRRDAPKTPRSHRESSKMAKESERASRSERRRREDRAEKRERKFVHPDSDSDERGQYEDSYNRRSEESRRLDDRKHRSRSDKYGDRAPKYKYMELEDEVHDYIARSQSSVRSGHGVRRTTSGLPESYARRSSARREPERTPRERRRGLGPEIVEDPSERVIPQFKTSTSSPTNLKMRVPPEHKTPPSFPRSETMPVSLRDRKETSSRLREPVEDSGYSSPNSPDDYQSAHRYSAYAYRPEGGVQVLDDRYHTVLREPDARSRRKSPSPARIRSSRHAPTPVTPSRPAHVRVVQPSSSSEDLPRSQSSLYSSVRHTQPGDMRDATNGRSPELLYREVRRDSPYTRVDPAQVQYAKKFGFNDVKYATGYNRRDYGRPAVQRTSTTAY